MIVVLDLIHLLAVLTALVLLLVYRVPARGSVPVRILLGLLFFSTLYAGLLQVEWSLGILHFEGVENILGALLPMWWAFLLYGLIQFNQERKLRASEEWHRVTLDSIGDAVIATDVEGRVYRMNAVAEQLTGWSSEQANGHPIKEVFRIVSALNREEVDSPVTRVLNTGQVIGLANHTLLLSRDGSEYQIADSGAPIRDDAGETRGVVLVFRDVTQDYELQEKLYQSQKMDAIGRLASGIAHDFNNMLGGILGGAELLQDTIPDTTENRECISLITDSARRAAELSSKLLAFARKQAVVFKPLDAHRMLRDTVSLLRNTIDKRITIIEEFGAENSSVFGDTTMLQSVFLNLGINAANAMQGEGELTLRTKCTMLEADYCEGSEFKLVPGRHLEVEVRDTGCGIASEHVKLIFEPFFTTKRSGEGTGLGLSAAHGAIVQHEGAISVYSELGKGSVFRVLLPLSNEEVDISSDTEYRIHGSGHILLVDDEHAMRVTGATMLKRLGYTVDTAKDGMEALEMLKQLKGEVDLVLLDMIMPRMNGTDCFHALRELYPDLPVVLASGFTQEDKLQDLLDHGLNGFLQKPYQSARLSRVVAQALRGQ